MPVVETDTEATFEIGEKTFKKRLVLVSLLGTYACHGKLSTVFDAPTRFMAAMPFSYVLIPPLVQRGLVSRGCITPAP